MKKFNLLNEIIVADRAALMQAVNGGREFGITIEGDVVAAPVEADRIYIYRGVIAPPKVSALAPAAAPRSLSELFGGNYKIVEDDERVLIKAALAWKQIIGLNIGTCDYDDTTADGVSHFTDGKLEDIGWHATEFGIGYRDLLAIIEAECDGVLLCIEQNEPYQFSGMGYIRDRERARELTYAYCKKRIAELMESDPDYAADNLTDDEAEAAGFFGLL